MRLRNIFTMLAAASILTFVGCQEPERFLDEVRVSMSYISLPMEGGDVKVEVDAVADWSIVAWNAAEQVEAEIPEWLTVEPASGSKGKVEVVFSAEATTESKEVVLHLNCDGACQMLNVVQITDPEHYWYDPTGKTLHLFMRANSHITGYCCVMKAVERVVDGKETISIECVRTPSGKRMIFLPMPGGQNKFFIKYDEKTKLYWLASVQARDSMRRIEYLSEDRYNIPSDERDRLALHFSSNMVDWCFAGLIAQSGCAKQARHYASMDIDGEDLVILSRSGDENAASAHNGNMITLHRVCNFRDLIY